MCVILKPLVPFDDAKLRCFSISRNIFAINCALIYHILDVYQGFVCENSSLLTAFNYLSAILFYVFLIFCLACIRRMDVQFKTKKMVLWQKCAYSW